MAVKDHLLASFAFPLSACFLSRQRMRGQPSRNFMRKEKHEQRRLIVRWFNPFFRIIDSRISGKRERERDVIYFATTLKGFFHRWEMRSAFFQLGTWNPRDNEWTWLDFVWIIEISRSKGCSRSVDLGDWLKERRINRLMKSMAFLYDCSLN